ncbi:MAG TPA: hypothetical protein PKY82_26485 [Pyrinomonadaceae bacterium]|nr:hypothetical protein [Pyrinomonadaceae bacterium]
MNRCKLLIASFAIILSFSAQILPQTQTVSLELEKLKQLRNSLSPSENNAGFDAQIKDLESDLAGNRLFSSLYKLQNLWLGLESFSYNEKRSLIVQDKLPLLEVEWKKVGED